MIGAILFLAPIVGSLVVVILWLFICPAYFDAKHIANKIDFDSVKKFYPINPDKWVLDDGDVMYNRMTSFRFSFIDYWRYRSWLKKQRKMQKDKKQNDAIAAVIKDVKKDIAKFEAKNKAYIEQQLNDIWDSTAKWYDYI